MKEKLRKADFERLVIIINPWFSKDLDPLQFSYHYSRSTGDPGSLLYTGPLGKYEHVRQAIVHRL